MILDSEIVPCDESYNILPFQILSTVITRKISIDKEIKDLKLKIIPFDILYLNNKSLTEIKLSERMKLLHENIKESKEIKFPIEYSKLEMYILFLFFIYFIYIRDHQTIERYTKEAKDNKCEGIVIKEIYSLYFPDKRKSINIKYLYYYL